MAKLELPALPWGPDALAPIISQATIDKHYGAHHRTYVEKGNGLIEGSRFSGMTHEEIIRESAQDPSARGVFNNAAQVWNHNRYWESLSPNGGQPSDALSAQIEKDLGGLASLKETLVKKGVGHFASGWVWLVWAGDKLDVIDTHDADTAMLHNGTELLTIDVWEHAYYIDYQNQREAHLRKVVEEILDWNRASAHFAEITGK
jgi:superoxide dismutase, Fe-Mn family